MNDNENLETNENVSDVQEYINTIADMKKNYVPKEQLDKANAEKKQLLNALSNGEQIKQEKKEFDVPGALKKLENPDITPLELWETKIALRDYYLEKTNGKKDIFMGFGKEYQAAPNEKERAENVAKCIKHCIEYADGDNEAFIAEKDRITAK